MIFAHIHRTQLHNSRYITSYCGNPRPSLKADPCLIGANMQPKGKRNKGYVVHKTTPRASSMRGISMVNGPRGGWKGILRALNTCAFVLCSVGKAYYVDNVLSIERSTQALIN